MEIDVELLQIILSQRLEYWELTSLNCDAEFVLAWVDSLPLYFAYANVAYESLCEDLKRD